ncbi:hypothetical protein DAPPUDRAFT_263756 [Daphnia pulex]|uniref:Uncharacterized protein n=1 Tax=Daphnia pulex TaxID=6669 RepID=E9HQD1_DAPPU|nr:hypothetical protein DAPPUDRAFT_263756 [Daphnia pulex]|eukprot:EFX66034.1 hypothetical protein DAPPUDRAFT_263756 [Daphnia pulex]
MRLRDKEMGHSAKSPAVDILPPPPPRGSDDEFDCPAPFGQLRKHFPVVLPLQDCLYRQ